MAFYPSRLICKIKNFFYVFFSHFFHTFCWSWLGWKHTRKYKCLRALWKCIRRHRNRLLSVRTSRLFPGIKSCHMFSDRQIFAEVFWCGRIAGKISNKKNDVSAPAIIKIYERILKGQRYICNIYTLPYIQKKYKQKKHKKAPLRSGAVLKKAISTRNQRDWDF